MKTVQCSKCEKKFTKPTTLLAEAALRMHVGRKHTRNIIANHEHTGVVRQTGNGHTVAVMDRPEKHPRSHITHAEADSLIGFIRDRQGEFPNKTACFRAALEANGLAGRLSDNSTAVSRYFAKAESSAPAQKRKYTRRQQQQPVIQNIHINFCPNCGCNVHAVATAIAHANLG